MILIDGDILIYRAAFAAQHQKGILWVFKDGREVFFVNWQEFQKYLKDFEISKEDGERIPIYDYEPPAHALHSLHMMLEKIKSRFIGEEVEIYIGSREEKSFRYELCSAGDYKAGRPPKPMHFDVLWEWLKNQNAIISVDNLETDDMIGLRAGDLRGNCTIISIDKDLRQIPANYYNFVTGEFFPKKQRLGEIELSGCRKKLTGSGLKFFWAQMLLGDNADNIKSISGLGPVAVFEKLEKLTTELDMMTTVYKLYEEEFKDDGKKFYENCDLLFIPIRREKQYPNQFKRKSLIVKEILG